LTEQFLGVLLVINGDTLSAYLESIIVPISEKVISTASQSGKCLQTVCLKLLPHITVIKEQAKL